MLYSKFIERMPNVKFPHHTQDQALFSISLSWKKNHLQKTGENIPEVCSPGYQGGHCQTIPSNAGGTGVHLSELSMSNPFISYIGLETGREL